MSDVSPQLNPGKIRLGLALVAVVFVVSVVLFVVADDTIARAIFFALGVFAIVRAVMLVRWLRREGPRAT
ncbi:MAG TPA: hypothetical protein VJM33_06995 [Microthrixaceae bacterium]|nr:hypothetical protein [Microthrixaceae bacterium]